MVEGLGGGAKGMPVFGLAIMSGGRSGVEGTLGVSGLGRFGLLGTGRGSGSSGSLICGSATH